MKATKAKKLKVRAEPVRCWALRVTINGKKTCFLSIDDADRPFVGSYEEAVKRARYRRRLGMSCRPVRVTITEE